MVVGPLQGSKNWCGHQSMNASIYVFIVSIWGCHSLPLYCFGYFLILPVEFFFFFFIFAFIAIEEFIMY